jgi:hypothetical protein
VAPYAGAYRRYQRVVPERQSERRGIHLTILSVLIALLTDAVTSAVTSSRQAYLVEFGRYLDGRGLTERPAARRPSV